MLSNIHVKNFALIDEANVALEDGLNILTGETGAGKSILIDAVNAALGAKAAKEVIGKRADYALVELIFFVRDPDRLDMLKEMDICPEEDGSLIISRKIMANRNVCRINDETVTVGRLRQITNLLIDIHGQHEHQSLLYPDKHLEILDDFARYGAAEIKDALWSAYQEYAERMHELEACQMDEEQRTRELDFLQFEIQEIMQAALKDGEEEELAAEYKKMANAGKIMEAMEEVLRLTGYENSDGAGEKADRALRAVSRVAAFDEPIARIQAQLEDIDVLLGDLSREINDYLRELTYDDRKLAALEKRLDQIRTIQAKYGGSFRSVMDRLEEKKERLERLEQMGQRREEAQEAAGKARKQVEQLADRLSEVRRVEAFHLTEAIRTALVDLNFLDVQFSMNFSRKPNVTANGYDEMEFLISTNPGEELKPLGQVASGGELSRIMLAIKAVLADTDEIETLIFDEIDAGISGRTAQKVSEKLHYIACSHQVICITHLPQIAAMADSHYRIEKSVSGGRTVTQIERLDRDDQIAELARLLGGAVITDAVMENAREMKELAESLHT